MGNCVVVNQADQLVLEKTKPGGAPPAVAIDLKRIARRLPRVLDQRFQDVDHQRPGIGGAAGATEKSGQLMAKGNGIEIGGGVRMSRFNGWPSFQIGREPSAHIVCQAPPSVTTHLVT